MISAKLLSYVSLFRKLDNDVVVAVPVPEFDDRNCTRFRVLRVLLAPVEDDDVVVPMLLAISQLCRTLVRHLAPTLFLFFFFCCVDVSVATVAVAYTDDDAAAAVEEGG